MQKDNRRLCSVCGKPLQKWTCSVCGGRGEIGHFFWKQTCGRCKGSGIEYKCPDHFKHEMEEIKRAMEKNIREQKKNYFWRELDRIDTCPLCGGTGVVYDQITKMEVPCPNCRKRQSLDQQSPPQSYGDIDGDGVPDAFDVNPFGQG